MRTARSFGATISSAPLSLPFCPMPQVRPSARPQSSIGLPRRLDSVTTTSWIEVGYGLEGTLPDATANAIIRNVIVPRFKSGDMADGISDGVDAIIAVLTGSSEEFKPSRNEALSWLLSNLVPVLFFVFFVIMIIVNFIRQTMRPHGSRYYRNSSGGWVYVDDDNDSGFSSGSSGDGGFSSGSSGGGGFSGGGGSFGGGGSSGRW